MGPTAAGKTALAVELVKRLPCEIISVDSAMVYRGMDIGTAKPGPKMLARAPHRLIDILDPAEAYSAARFRADARREMDAVRAEGRVPLLVGGTMLYFQALRRGLAPLPSAQAELRRAIDEEASTRGWAMMHRELARIDPPSAARIHRNDPQRIQRALEVYRITGRPLSEHLARAAREPLPYRLVEFVVSPPARSVLHARIERRLDEMLDRGFVAEVAALRARPDLGLDAPSMRAVGYRQIWEHLDGLCDASEMRRRAIVATRRFAKRQYTWLRSESAAARLDPGVCGFLDKALMTIENSGIMRT
jgi:tRNA dimethylallyltransferase